MPRAQSNPTYRSLAWASFLPSDQDEPNSHTDMLVISLNPITIGPAGLKPAGPYQVFEASDR